MPVQNDRSYRFTHNVDENVDDNVNDMRDSNDPNGNETYHDSEIADERTLEWTYHLDSLPSEQLAAYIWPRSVYEAAQHVYPTYPPLTQPYNVPIHDHVVAGEESWQPVHTAPSSFQDRSQHLEPLQMNGVNATHDEGFFATNYPDRGSGSTIDDVTPLASENANDANLNAVNSKPSLRCPVCKNKPPFTGQYAQRNLNRHMERHDPCVSPRNSRHIRCGQPGCTSTFGREDALLVHLRRSHPALNTPPAKKRKR